jgi:AcrR family transcriptional regulator
VADLGEETSGKEARSTKTGPEGTAPRRSPSAGGYARGEETRARIIAAALKVFGEEGYDRASTRQIARAAGVMPPALQYYFDSKEGLHRACAESLLEAVTPGIQAAFDQGERVLAEGNAAAAVEGLCDLLDALLDVALVVKGSPDPARFSARIQTEKETPAGVLVQTRISAPMRDLCARLVARATGTPLDDTARLRAMALMGQHTAFHLNRDAALNLLDWPDFNGPRRDAIKAVVRANTRAALRG